MHEVEAMEVKAWDRGQRGIKRQLQTNLNTSNTNGQFTMANSNSFLSPYEILPTAQENKYLGKFSCFIMRLYMYVVYSH